METIKIKDLITVHNNFEIIGKIHSEHTEVRRCFSNKQLILLFHTNPIRNGYLISFVYIDKYLKPDEILYSVSIKKDIVWFYIDNLLLLQNLIDSAVIGTSGYQY